MPDQKYVPLDAFVAVTKRLFSQVCELSANVMALRAALMQAQAVPISDEELQRLDAFFRDYEPIRKARETVQALGVDTTADMLEVLKNFEGPIQ